MRRRRRSTAPAIANGTSGEVHRDAELLRARSSAPREAAAGRRGSTPGPGARPARRAGGPRGRARSRTPSRRSCAMCSASLPRPRSGRHAGRQPPSSSPKKVGSQLAPPIALPEFVEIATGWSNTLQLRTVQGASTTTNATAAASAARRPAGLPRSGTSSSARRSRRLAARQRGQRDDRPEDRAAAQRSARGSGAAPASSETATSSTYSDSDMSAPSVAISTGYTAPSAAAIRPARSPAQPAGEQRAADDRPRPEDRAGQALERPATFRRARPGPPARPSAAGGCSAVGSDDRRPAGRTGTG